MRPALKRGPTDANMRRAGLQAKDIERRIANGTFDLLDEFPDYPFTERLPGSVKVKKKTCNEVFDEYLSDAQSRMAMNDLAFATVEGYRKILNYAWRPSLGERLFEDIVYSDLAKIANQHGRTKKTYNNITSVVRVAFDYGYRDHPEKHNTATNLKYRRITKKDKAPIDPFAIQEAENLIAAIHADWGEAQGNYDEFRFFTGLRPSEQIALRVTDCDIGQGKINVTKARVMARDKDRTKTSNDRLVELCPRALDVLERHLALRARLKLAGSIQHEDLFFKEDGSPIRNLQYPWTRWRSTLKRMKARYREPYNARHSSVSWNLMIGKNPLWVAKQHGHSVQTMLDDYATWLDGTRPEDVERIKRAFESGSPMSGNRAAVQVRSTLVPCRPLEPPTSVTNSSRPPHSCRGKSRTHRGFQLAEREGFEPSKGF